MRILNPLKKLLINSCEKIYQKKVTGKWNFLLLLPVLRIRDVYPGSRIPDPKTATKERGEKKCVVITFYVATNFTKLQIILVLKWWRKKIWANFQRIIELFTQKIVTKLSKIWIWDLGSEIRDPEKPIPDPGSRGQKGTGSWIPDPDPQHCTVCKSQNQTKWLIKKHILLMCLRISFYIYFRSVRRHFVQKSPALLYSIVAHHVFKRKWEIFFYWKTHFVTLYFLYFKM